LAAPVDQRTEADGLLTQGGGSKGAAEAAEKEEAQEHWESAGGAFHAAVRKSRRRMLHTAL
jgi:hypothetical protein